MTTEILRTLPDGSPIPVFDEGWVSGARLDPYLSYLGEPSPEGWSGDLEALHGDSTTDHFIDLWTREAVMAALRAAILPAFPVILDLGCSSGLMTAEMLRAWPDAFIIGLDAEADGLAAAHAAMPGIPFVHASGTELPLADSCLDAVASLNVLEHIPEDVQVLDEVHRVLRPGGTAVVVVPYNPALYDYYDVHLQHARRYERREMAEKGRSIGLMPVTSACLGSALYPAFWATKKLHRRRHPDPSPAERQRLVEKDIQSTRHASVGRLAHRLERRLIAAGLRPRFGIRQVTVFRKPRD